MTLRLSKLAQPSVVGRWCTGNKQSNIDIFFCRIHGLLLRRHWLNKLMQSVRYRKKGGKLATLGTLLQLIGNF